MECLKEIPPSIYLIASILLITTAIAVLFLEQFIFAIISLVIGFISLTAWTFFGLFEETINT